MKVLLYGRGWLSGFFETYLSDRAVEYSFSQERVSFENLENLQAELESVQPTHLLCCLGRTHGPGYGSIDYLEDRSKLGENLKDNVFAPIILGMEATARNLHLTYIGTGCIFEYDENHDLVRGMLEKDYPNFFGSAYSTAKGFTDSFFKSYLSQALLLRIRMPVSKYHNSRNFISKILSYPKVASIPNSVTCIEDLFPIAVDMMIRERRGIYNFVNTGTITHSEIIDYYTTHVNPNHLVQYVAPEDLPVKAGRSNVFLDNSKLREEYPIKTPQEVIFSYLKDFPVL